MRLRGRRSAPVEDDLAPAAIRAQAAWRRSGRSVAWLAAVLLLLASQTPPLLAFTLERVNNDPCDTRAANLLWDSRSAAVAASLLSPPVYRSLVDTARARWNESVPAFLFSTRGGRDFCDNDDGVVTMAFSPTDCAGVPLGDALAVTRLVWEVPSGRLIDTDTVFTPDFADAGSSTNQQIFLEVVLHELGHVLGLDHSDACGASGEGTLMRSRLFLSGPRLDRPQADDVAGARAIYSAGGGEPLPEGANSCAVQQPRGFAPPLWAAFFALIARRLRRLPGDFLC